MADGERIGITIKVISAGATAAIRTFAAGMKQQIGGIQGAAGRMTTATRLMSAQLIALRRSATGKALMGLGTELERVKDIAQPMIAGFGAIAGAVAGVGLAITKTLGVF